MHLGTTSNEEMWSILELIVFVLVDIPLIDLSIEIDFIYGWKIKTNLECSQ